MPRSETPPVYQGPPWVRQVRKSGEKMLDHILGLSPLDWEAMRHFIDFLENDADRLHAQGELCPDLDPRERPWVRAWLGRLQPAEHARARTLAYQLRRDIEAMPVSMQRLVHRVEQYLEVLRLLEDPPVGRVAAGGLQPIPATAAAAA